MRRRPRSVGGGGGNRARDGGLGEDEALDRTQAIWNAVSKRLRTPEAGPQALALAGDGGPPPHPPWKNPPHTHTHATHTQLFGLMYTLQRERWDFNKRWVAGRLALEHLQIAALVLQPRWLWRLPYGT